MSSRKRGRYSFSLNDSVVRPGAIKKNRPRSRVILLLMVLVVVGVGAYYALGSKPDGLLGYLPFPKKLILLRFEHNGQEVVLLPDSQCLMNPRDTLQLVQVKTDGWLSWGVRVASSDMDAKAIQKKGAVVRDQIGRAHV